MRAFSGKGLFEGRGVLGLSPETRLILTFSASVFSLVFGNLFSLGILVFASAAYLCLEAKLKTIVIAYLIFAVMAAVALLCVWLMGFVFPGMRTRSLFLAIAPFMRLLISVNTIIPLAINAKLSDLVKSLNRLRLPGLIKLPLLITIRFIPTFMNDLSQLRVAIRLRFRGKGGFFFWIRRPLLWWRVFFMPLVIRLIRSADELALAAELKGLSARTDFGSETLVLNRVDRVTLLLAAYGVAAATLARVFHA